MRRDCLGNALQHCSKEYFWDEVYMRPLKNKIANPLSAVLISIKVAASQVEHLLDALHLLGGEEREQQAAWHRAEHGFLKVCTVLGHCKRASTKVCQAGNVGCRPFPVGKELDFCISGGRRSSELSWTHKCFGATWACLQQCSRCDSPQLVPR